VASILVTAAEPMSQQDSCFVIMPYHTKKDVDGKDVDFDEIYDYIIKEAVQRVPALQCIRCDDFDQPGWIPARMLTQILEARVAVVDISTLNANVFYELGVRHALRKSITVLIRRKGTNTPFNIEGMSSIEYDSTGARAIDEAKAKIHSAIVSAIDDTDNIDSLVYQALPDLKVHRGVGRVPARVTKVQVFEFPLRQNPDKRLGLVTGDREYLTIGDVWVNSENTNMQMDRFYGASTSATIRYLGARKNAAGMVKEDTIEEELRRKMAAEEAIEVQPATVFVTGSGALRDNNNVKRIFHVATVNGEPREGYKPVANLERCVTNAIREAGRPDYQSEGLTSMVFPILGTGAGGGSVVTHAERCFKAAIEFMESNPTNPIQRVYFYVWTDIDLENCLTLIASIPGLSPRANAG
jgi:O-acetyl-ADP-ribose deacetylase (regulator of RNase III)